MYPADGKFRKPSKRDWLQPQTGDADAELRLKEVPPSVDLRSDERVVEDFEPPARAVSVVQERRALREVSHAFLRLMYGRENVLRAPTSVTTDSRQRVIITDPALPAVHVLDKEGKNSFRIMGGPSRRIRKPTGVAVDEQDKIYVADSQMDIVLVYRADGSFIRSIGDLGGGEGLFHEPRAIAIDRSAGRLYVADSSRVFMLDLQGNVLKRVGRPRRGTAIADFDEPADLAVGKNVLAVLETDGSRIHLMDLQLNVLRTIRISSLTKNGAMRPSVSIDDGGKLYVTRPSRSAVQVFNGDGESLGSFGKIGRNEAEFNAPAGITVDMQNRIYVADTKNRRVQVFQISQPLTGTATEALANGR